MQMVAQMKDRKYDDVYLASLENVTKQLFQMVGPVEPLHKPSTDIPSLAYLLNDDHRAELLQVYDKHVPALLRLVDLVKAVDAPLRPLVDHKQLTFPAVDRIFSPHLPQLREFSFGAWKGTTVRRPSFPPAEESRFPVGLYWARGAQTAVTHRQAAKAYSRDDVIQAGLFLAILEYDRLDWFTQTFQDGLERAQRLAQQLALEEGLDEATQAAFTKNFATLKMELGEIRAVRGLEANQLGTLKLDLDSGTV